MNFRGALPAFASRASAWRNVASLFLGALLYSSMMPVPTVNAQSSPTTFQSRDEQTALLELCTSEGCSSCPPAEQWLSDPSSDVKAGENRGLHLNHDFVVTALTTGSLTRQGDTIEGELEFTPPQSSQPKRLALAVWVTRPGNLEPLQAVGGWLPVPF